MVLIVGGRYGAPTSQSKLEEERNNYDKDYVSITRREFETASAKNIPILIFVDKNVYAEYQTYKENQSFLENIISINAKSNKEGERFVFAHVDHINVFKFIDTIRNKPIKTFEKVEEIETYIKLQISGMFYLYLESLKKISEDNKILDTISELNNVTLRMNEMLSSVGKEILGKDKKEYERVIESQFDIMLDFFREKFSSNLEFENELSEDELKLIDFDKTAKIFFDKALIVTIPIVDPKLETGEWIKRFNDINTNLLKELEVDLLTISDKLKIKRFTFRNLNNDLKNKVLPFMNNMKDQNKLLDRIKVVIQAKLSKLPF